jgi:thiamine-phosphate pyrophosphorylase
MKLLVISPTKTKDNEIRIVKELFENGLDTYHLRKPKQSTKELRAYIKQIPEYFHNRIIIHSHHNLAREFNLKGIHLTKQHLEHKWKLWLNLNLGGLRNKNLIITQSKNTLASLYEPSEYKFNYVLLRPLFDPLTNVLQSGFHPTGIKAAMEKVPFKIIVGGGINLTTIKICAELGVEGVILGTIIWKNENPLNAFLEIANYLNNEKIGIE